ncbi:MAG: response regulator transcription factor [Gemmatimonadota bacterium]|nr:MAG: response regulator transcription factor [Gemmatimonadota bacterium]
MTKILVVEDNTDLAFGLQKTLETEGYEVDVAYDGRTGLKRAQEFDPDLVVLDLMLPELDGYALLREARRTGLEIPVLILTARAEEADKVLGLDWGADDYVTKPFGTLELLARVRALLRRVPVGENGTVRSTTTEQFGDVQVDTASHIVLRKGITVSLTPKEYDLLLALIERRGAVATRDELLREVWKYEADVMTRTVDMHVAELRRKLEQDPAKPKHILTVRKVGYRLHA